MELAAPWHRCQNLPKSVNTSLPYKERGNPVKDGLANQSIYHLDQSKEGSFTSKHGSGCGNLAAYNISMYSEGGSYRARGFGAITERLAKFLCHHWLRVCGAHRIDVCGNNLNCIKGKT